MVDDGRRIPGISEGENGTKWAATNFLSLFQTKQCAKQLFSGMLPYLAWCIRTSDLSLRNRFMCKMYIWLVLWSIFFMYWECHHPNWLSCFSEGFKPPTRLCLMKTLMAGLDLHIICWWSTVSPLYIVHHISTHYTAHEQNSCIRWEIPVYNTHIYICIQYIYIYVIYIYDIYIYEIYIYMIYIYDIE